MFCNVSACDDADDSIKIFINKEDDDQSDVQMFTVNYENIGQQRVWQKMNFVFDIEDPVLDVIINICEYSLFQCSVT